VLESNRDLVLRRLTECLGRDRTKHQVTEITSLGLVQMTRKRIGAGLLEAFSETCEHCKGRGVLIHTEPVPEKRSSGVVNQVKAVAAAARTEPAQSGSPQSGSPQSGSQQSGSPQAGRSRRRRGGAENAPAEPAEIEIEVGAEAQGPAAAELPPAAGSGIVARTAPGGTVPEDEDEYDISGYDLSRYEANGPAALVEDAEPLRLTGADDPDAAEDDDDDDDGEPVGAGAGRRRSRRGGSRRRTRP
jgi:ribonuclease E